MNALLENLPLTIWRASWQGAVLALVVAVVIRSSGERLAPKWRYLLWSVVLARFLVVATPASSWSAFNLLPGNPPAAASQTAPQVVAAAPALEQQNTGPALTESGTPAQDESAAPPNPADPPALVPIEPRLAQSADAALPAPAIKPAPALTARWDRLHLAPVLAACWLIGCLGFALHLLAAAFALRRQLSACRPVTDPALLDLFERACRRIGLKHPPALVVTPAAISPCLVGTWRPRLVLPESLATEIPAARLQHVLAHELAHLQRGDLWTNWLLLTVRIVHWFNPLAWWTVREMQAEREEACDELALAALGDADRPAYAATILDLAASLAPSAIAPGMIGLYSSTQRLQSRVERLIHRPAVAMLRPPLAGGLVALLALAGLTDALPAAPRDGAPAAGSKPSTATAPAAPDGAPATEANTYTLKGRCVDRLDRGSLTGISIRLFKVEGRSALPVEIAKTASDEEGRFEFRNLVPPRSEARVDRLVYLVFGLDDDLPIGVGYEDFRGGREYVIGMGRDSAKLSGRVIDANGKAVAGAAVTHFWLEGRPIPGLLSTTTGADGRFTIDRLDNLKSPNGAAPSMGFSVVHPDYPVARPEFSLPATDVVVTLPDGCKVTGTVTDGATGKPAAGAVLSVRSVENAQEIAATTDKAGRYHLAVPEGRYVVLAEATDRVCEALLDREFLTGEKVELPPLKLTGGGLIAGQVINTKTGEPVAVSDSGEPIALGLVGPSQPTGRTISPLRLAFTDSHGRFVLRAAPGKNFPYFVNTRGDRMAWDTEKQPAVIVTEGETTAYNMLITPEATGAEKMEAARAVVASLSKKPAERTEQIIAQFRKLGHTVDETELWCSLMRELVAVGHDAVPPLCAELDRTTVDRAIRRLAFALRAIGDPRAVPALIRAIPRTHLPSSSDYGLLVADQALTEFMQAHDLDEGRGGTYFGFGRPVREVFGTLHLLTGQNFDDDELYHISRAEDPRRQALQRRLYQRNARRWQTWWEEHWREFTEDVSYRKFNLAAVDEPLPPAPTALGPGAKLGDGMREAIISPAVEENRYAWHFYDLDTGYRPKWPDHIARDEAHIDWKLLEAWAKQTGVDLMCVTRDLPNGAETYALRTFGTTSREIGPRDFRNIDRLVATGTLPEGRPVGELLQHYDAESQELVLDANGAFIVTTREGSLFLIEITDRVTRTANLTGQPAGRGPAGVGFYKGVRFNLKSIIP